MLDPLINSKQETSKATQDKILASQALVNNALFPFIIKLQRRNDQVDTLQQFPYYQAQIDQPIPIVESTPEKKSNMIIDLDKSLNTTDRENLEDMKFQLPLIVFTTDTYEPVIQRIKSENRSIGQFLRKGPVGKKMDAT